MDFKLNYLNDEKIGDWEISSFKIDEFYAKARNLFIKNPLMKLKAGEYKKLTNKNCIVMSNTPMEQITHIKAINNAHGNVLIAGLGLGMFLHNIKNKKNIESITVIEYSNEVIQMVGKYFKEYDKIKIINENIFDYIPNIKFDFAFFDIWSDISEENRKDFQILKEKFSEINEIICWSEDILDIDKTLMKKEIQ